MVFRLFDRRRNAFATEGPGTLTSGSAQTGATSIATGMSTGDTTLLAVSKGSQWEVGLYTHTSPDQWARTEIWDSTNGGAAVDFTAGTGAMDMDVPARILDRLWLREISVATASTCDIFGVFGEKIVLTGTTTVISLGTTPHKVRLVRSAGTFTLTNHATTLILPGEANIAVGVGDTFIAASDGSGNGRVYNYTYGDGRVVTPSLTATNATISTLLTLSQIKFPATQVASANANTLDDYEEGTYTPTITPAAGTFTTASATGWYTKVGNLLSGGAIGTITAFGTGTGFTFISLPFGVVQVGTVWGRETLNTGDTLNGEFSGSGLAAVAFYNNGFTAGANNTLRIGFQASMAT